MRLAYLINCGNWDPVAEVGGGYKIKAEGISAFGGFSSQTEARPWETMGVASAKGICQNQLGFINCLANRGEHLEGGN